MPEEIKQNPLYKMLDEAPNHFVMQDHEGKKEPFVVAKEHLDEDMHDTVRKLGIQPNANDYTQPPTADVSGDLSKAASSVGSFLHSFDKGPESNPASMQNTPGLAPFMAPQFKSGLQASTVQPQQMTETPASPTEVPKESQVLAPKSVQPAVNSELSTLNSAYKDLAEGHTKEAEALGKAADEQATAYHNQQVQQEALNARYNRHRQELEAQGQEIYKDVLDKKVDPNHYVHGRGTWNRISGAIAVALGGLGGGLNRTGQNLALDTINKGIERDIDSQKEDIRNNQTLYAKNLEALHDADMAHSLTTSQLLAVTQAKVQEAAAKASNPAMQGRLQQLMADLKMKQQAAQHELATKQALARVGQPGQEGNVNPELLDKEHKDRLVQLPNGKQYFTLTPEDAKEIKTKTAGLFPIEEELKKLDSLGPSALIPGSPEANEAHAIISGLVPMVNEFKGINRLSVEDEKLVKELINNPTKLVGGTNRSETLRRSLYNTLEGNYRSRLTNYTPSYVPKNAVSLGKVKQQVAAVTPKQEK